MKQATRDRRAAAGQAPGTPVPRQPGRALPSRIVDGWLQAIDPVAAVRGMSSGFSVLVIGSLLAPLVATRIPGLGSLALTIAAVAGFIVAASRQGSSRAPGRQGATAAVGAYFLVLPLVYFATHRWDLTQIGLTVLTAIVVGALVGHLTALLGRLGTTA